MMKLLGAVAIGVTLAMAVPSFAEEKEAAEKIELKDGTMLYLHADGTGRMVDEHGKSMRMSDDTPMETADGRMIMMKNKWVRVRMVPKGSPMRKVD